MSLYEDARTALALLTPEEIRRLLGEMEREHGIALTPNRDEESSFRCAVAYGIAPLPMGLMDDQRGWVVRLVAVGPNKILVIKTIREMCGLGLVEAVQIINAVPGIVRSFNWSDKTDAELLAERLQSVGSTVLVCRA